MRVCQSVSASTSADVLIHTYVFERLRFKGRQALSLMCLRAPVYTQEMRVIGRRNSSWKGRAVSLMSPWKKCVWNLRTLVCRHIF